MGGPGWSRKKHKFPCWRVGGYFRLEARQVLRLAYILTFTALNTRGSCHVSARFYEGGVVLLAEGRSNVLECSRIFRRIGSTGRWCTRVLAE
jgi:hypothetical protein